MEMHQARYFLAVAEELNFTRAAEKCGVTQPTMTRAIKLLEQELGGLLVNRDGIKTHLTEFGRMMLPFMQQICEQAAAAKRHADSFRRSEQTMLKLGLMCTIAPTTLIELVRDMRLKHPTIELQISDATGAELDEKLCSGELDVAIFAHPEGFSDRLHKVSLYLEPFVIAVAKDSPIANRQSIAVIDLDGMEYIERMNCEFGNYADHIFKQQGVEDRTVYRSDRDDWVLAMVAAGLGYSFLPKECAVHSDIVAIPLENPGFTRDVSLVTVRGRPHSAALGALIQEATRCFRRPFKSDS